MVLRRGYYVAVALACAVALSGCAAAGGMAVNAAVENVQAPAIAALETGMVAYFDNAAAKLEHASEAEVVEIGRGATIAMARLATARLAYDATFGAGAPAATQALVQAVRYRTDEAYTALMDELAVRLAPT